MKQPHYLLCLVALSCCIVSVICSCGPSAPEITLRELNSGCSHRSKSRTAQCARAMNQFCTRVAYPHKMTTLGVSRENGPHRIGMSCVRARWAANVHINTLRRIHGGCNTVHKSQHRDCLSAIHRFCAKHFGHNHAGISQGVVTGHLIPVACFALTRKENVRHSVLRAMHPNCKFPNSHSDSCFAAASRWCSKYFGYTGGLTLEVNHLIMTVGCYNAEFSGDVFTARVVDFYRAMSQAKEVCNLKYDIPKGKILGAVPDVLKNEVYDNTKSNTPLDSSFEISKEVKETCRFTYSSTWKFSAEYSFKWGVPNVAQGSIKYNWGSTYSLSLTRQNTVTKRYVQTSTVHVPPKTKIIKEAKVTKAYVQVPWTATIMNGLGAIKTIRGKWYGVSTFDLQIDQRNG